MSALVCFVGGRAGSASSSGSGESCAEVVSGGGRKGVGGRGTDEAGGRGFGGVEHRGIILGVRDGFGGALVRGKRRAGARRTGLGGKRLAEWNGRGSRRSLPLLQRMWEERKSWIFLSAAVELEPSPRQFFFFLSLLGRLRGCSWMGSNPSLGRNSLTLCGTRRRRLGHRSLGGSTLFSR